MNKLIELFKANRFTTISWGVTALLVVALLGSAVWWTQAGSASPATRLEPTARPDQNLPSVSMPAVATSSASSPTIPRQLQLKTIIPTDEPRLHPISYTTQGGDGLQGIAQDFNLKPNSILYSNKIPYDDPMNLKPGDVLTIPPIDGILYKWQDGDTLQKIADKFKAKPDDILNFPGNDIDLTNPQIKTGTVVMIPGGKRELIDYTPNLPTNSRVNNGSTGTSDFAGNSSCPGVVGPVDNSFGFPTLQHWISGNDYTPTHLGIDLAANANDPISAAAAGIVTMAQGGYNYGYGNVVEIDNGNGYLTVYAHLNSYTVSPCEIVQRGAIIGYAGATGNATGAHLHFEIRRNGANVNPHDYGL